MQSHPIAVLQLLIAVVCASVAAIEPVSQDTRRAFDVVHYAARVEPDIDNGSVRGTVVVSLLAEVDGLRLVELDRGALTIDAAREGDARISTAANGGRVAIQLQHPAARGERRDIEIDYHGTPRFGLELVPERSQAYTIFSTSQWLIAVDAPEDRATLDLTLVLPEGLMAVASGRREAQRPLPDGKVAHEFRLDTPAPTYTFGFAAGAFNEVVEQHDDVTLVYLGDGFSDEELRRIFADTAAMIDFFEERAGVAYFGEVYAQALVAETIGQEMAGLAVLSEEFGRGELEDPRASSLAAHELAHQWWGNMVTCRDWTHFWLNEGFATFMAAAWEEQRFGRARYLSRIAASRERYERVRDAGGDNSLVFADWDRPTSADRTLVYHKGALVLHELRAYLGDDAFWAGVRAYTRTYFGRSVTTAEFQAAMEEASGRDLADFFAEWIYAGGSPSLGWLPAPRQRPPPDRATAAW